MRQNRIAAAERHSRAAAGEAVGAIPGFKAPGL